MKYTKQDVITAVENYKQAKAAYDTIYEESRKHDKERDQQMIEEGNYETIGNANGDYIILPKLEAYDEDHEIWVKGQEILDRLNPACDKMYETARTMFEVVNEHVIEAQDLPEEKIKEMREAVEIVSKQAYVEKGFRRMTEICLKVVS